jgi:hypothetical protein
VNKVALVLVLVVMAGAGLWVYRTFGGDPYVTRAKYGAMLDEVAKDFGAEAVVTTVSLAKHGGSVTVLTDGRTVQASKTYGTTSNKTELGTHTIFRSEVAPAGRDQPALSLARLRRLDPAADARKLLGAGPGDVSSFDIRHGIHGWRAEVDATVGGVARHREERLP